MATANDRGRRMNNSLLGRAVAFLGIVLYVNVRHDHAMTPIDWGVIAFAVAFLAIALFRRYRDDR